MKKALSLFLALALILALTACGGNPVPAPATPSSPPAPSSPATPGSSAAAGTFEAEGRQYITADQLKSDIEAGKDLFLLDIQPESNFNEHHLQGVVATFAFPVETDGEKAAVDAVLGDAAGKSLVIICPGGKKGANNTWDHLSANGYDMSTVFILENGQNGWPHAGLLETAGGVREPAMVVDAAKGTVTIPCEINGKYFTEPTYHGIVFVEGKNAEKSMLRGLTSEKEFHAALVELGAVPGDNLTMADMKADGTGIVEGTALDVTVTWDGAGRDIPFADIIVSSDPKPIDIRFGGNIAVAEEVFPGCILCLASCVGGITSNAAYPTSVAASGSVEFNSNGDVLPEDGALVYVTFKVNA